MDPKLLCPTLTIMLTKTIKALCEVNIKFDNKLEICGSLHIRSDGEKILTCLIDEESFRLSSGTLLTQRNNPETMLAQQSAVMALLTASHQMTTSRSPGISSPPQQVTTESHHTSASQPDPQAAPVHQAVAATPQTLQQPPAAAKINTNNNSLSSVNSLTSGGVSNPEVLLGMLQDRCRKESTPARASPQPKHSTPSSANNMHHIKQEPPDAQLMQGTPNGGLPHLAGLPSFPMLVNSAAWSASLAPNLGNALSPEHVPSGTKRARTQSSVNGNTAMGLSQDLGGSSPGASSLPDPEILTTVNSKGQKKFQCMFCGILLSTKNYLKNHINAVHTKSRVYPCELCERFFYSAGALRIHKLRHHWANSKKHHCPRCRESFLLPVELRRHLVKKHGEDEVTAMAGNGGAESEGEVVKEGTEQGKVKAEKNLTIEQLHQLQVQGQQYQQNLEKDNNLMLYMTEPNQEQDDEMSVADLSSDSLGSIPHTVAAQMYHSHLGYPAKDLPGGPMRAEFAGPALTEGFHPQSQMFGVDSALNYKGFSMDKSLGYILPQSQTQQVVVQPEAPPDGLTTDSHIHPNQNEMGIPDDLDDFDDADGHDLQDEVDEEFLATFGSKRRSTRSTRSTADLDSSGDPDLPGVENGGVENGSVVITTVESLAVNHNHETNSTGLQFVR